VQVEYERTLATTKVIERRTQVDRMTTRLTPPWLAPGYASPRRYDYQPRVLFSENTALPHLHTLDAVTQEQMQQADGMPYEKLRLLLQMTDICDFGCALKLFAEAARRQPENPYAIYNLALICIHANHIGHGVQYFLEAADHAPGGSVIWAKSVAMAFAGLTDPASADDYAMPKPVWWEDEALKSVSMDVVMGSSRAHDSSQGLHESPRFVDACESVRLALLMRAKVMGGCVGPWGATWGARDRSALELIEAGECFRQLARLPGCTADSAARYARNALLCFGDAQDAQDETLRLLVQSARFAREHRVQHAL